MREKKAAVIEGFKQRPDIFYTVLSDSTDTNSSIEFLREKAFEALGAHKMNDSYKFELFIKAALGKNEKAVNLFANILENSKDEPAPAVNNYGKSLLQIAQMVVRGEKFYTTEQMLQQPEDVQVNYLINKFREPHFRRLIEATLKKNEEQNFSDFLSDDEHNKLRAMSGELSEKLGSDEKRFEYADALKEIVLSKELGVKVDGVPQVVVEENLEYPKLRAFFGNNPDVREHLIEKIDEINAIAMSFYAKAEEKFESESGKIFKEAEQAVQKIKTEDAALTEDDKLYRIKIDYRKNGVKADIGIKTDANVLRLFTKRGFNQDEALQLMELGKLRDDATRYGHRNPDKETENAFVECVKMAIGEKEIPVKPVYGKDAYNVDVAKVFQRLTHERDDKSSGYDTQYHEKKDKSGGYTYLSGVVSKKISQIVEEKYNSIETEKPKLETYKQNVLSVIESGLEKGRSL